MSTIGIANLLSFKEIFKDNYFIIPDYQRGYSWEDKQLMDLRKDIDNLFDRDHMHYTGTLVATPTERKKNTFDIVDGQQRLTSLVILLKTIYDLNPIQNKDLFQLFIQRGKLGNERLVITPNNETKYFYEELIIKGTKPTPEVKSHNCLSYAFDFFNKWLKEDGVDSIKIKMTVIEKLGFLFFTPLNDKEIGIMFEVINNRGKELSELEKIKNYFIYYASVHDRLTLRKKINTKWEFIQKYLSKANVFDNEDENYFLRYCYLVYYSYNKTKSWYVYDDLKARYVVHNKDKIYIDESIAEIQGFVDFLETASLHYAFLFNSQGYFNTYYPTCLHKTRLSKVLKLIRCQSVHASIMPLYLAIMRRQDKPDRIIELLELLEKVNFRIYMLPKITARADTKQGDMFWFAYYLFKNPNWVSTNPDLNDKYTNYNEKAIKGDIFDWVKIQLIEITKYLCPESKFIESLTLDKDEPDDYYTWHGLRYFLANYEFKLQKGFKHTWDIELINTTRLEAAGSENDYLSREHIWALKNRTDEFAQDYHEKRRLGNFVLLGLSKNISLSNSDIPQKIDEIQGHNNKQAGKFHMYQVDELDKIYNEALKFINNKLKRYIKTKMYYENLSYKINDIRETTLIQFALERWCLPYEKFDRFDKVDTYYAKENNKKEMYILKK